MDARAALRKVKAALTEIVTGVALGVAACVAVGLVLYPIFDLLLAPYVTPKP